MTSTVKELTEAIKLYRTLLAIIEQQVEHAKHYSEAHQNKMAELGIAAIKSFSADHLAAPETRNAALAEAECKPREYTTPYGHKLSKLAELALTLANAVEDTRGQTSTTITINSPDVTVSGTDIHIDAYSTRAAQ